MPDWGRIERGLLLPNLRAGRRLILVSLAFDHEQDQRQKGQQAAGIKKQGCQEPLHVALEKGNCRHRDSHHDGEREADPSRSFHD